jgi:hypothetical protein
MKHLRMVGAARSNAFTASISFWIVTKHSCAQIEHFADPIGTERTDAQKAVRVPAEPLELFGPPRRALSSSRSSRNFDMMLPEIGHTFDTTTSLQRVRR